MLVGGITVGGEAAGDTAEEGAVRADALDIETVAVVSMRDSED